MSWLSKKVNRARKFTDTAGKNLGMSEDDRKWFRVGVSSMGGGMGLQYEYSRNKGMNSDEATKNAVSGGAQYSETRGMQRARVAEDAAQEQDKKLALRQAAEQTRARGMIAARVRRAGRSDRPSTKGGTIATGALGVPGSGQSSSFASLLGL